MELFKTAQRIPPRRIPVVRRYLALPAPKSVSLAVNPRKTRGAFTAIGGIAAVMLMLGGIKAVTDQPEQAPTVKPKGSAAPSATPSFRVIKSGGGGGGGGGGGFGGPSAGPLVQERASGNVVSQIRKIIFTLKKDPSTRSNMTDRLALFGKYFNGLSPSDRIALFGTIDFRQLEHAVRVQGDKGPQALDRCLAQLQLIVF